MLLGALLCLSTAAAPPVSLALPGLNGVNLAAGEGELYTELLAQKLDEQGLKVISGRDIGAALGLERQRELLGCTETLCTAKLAGALGVEGIVVADIGKLGASYAVNVKVLSKDGRTLAIFNSEGAEVRPLLGAGARAIAHQLATAMGRPELEPKPLPPVQVEQPTGRSPLLRPAGITVFAVGIAAVAFGVGCQMASLGKLNALRVAPTEPEAAALRDEGKSWQSAGGALIGIGLAAAFAGGVMMIMGVGPARPSVTLLPGGAAFALTGTWP